MNIIHLPAGDGDGPSAQDLASIEREWPLIEAELALLDAEIAYITAGPAASALDRRRVRRAQRRVLTVGRELTADQAVADGAA
ncbi:hypothetical protein EV138_1127 [Kribbella voronezhensis]|uniref:Uncharacterized protein n=1 Tax=Kribbella voronezhensis TaxID=2512212 RepID=A0A4V3FJT8_9ACTN|nr:DUF6284 family protein [Kribbella voronezhensis]TDU87603.1 hypothetical protein EV138_1127 [Kribbella voronezhensis]